MAASAHIPSATNCSLMKSCRSWICSSRLSSMGSAATNSRARRLSFAVSVSSTAFHRVSRSCHSAGGFIESWGRGIEKICSACEKDGVPQPEYTINPGDIMIKFTAPEDRLIRSVTSRVTEKVTDKVTDTLDETSLKILNLLAVDPAYTTTFLAENLSLSRKTVSLRLKILKEKGLIERIGSDRKGYWKLLK